MLFSLHPLLLILVSGAVTALIRFLPFLLFRKQAPAPILYLGRVLPPAIMMMLVVYCLKSVSLFSGTHGLPELLAILAVILVHKWKHNTLLSILIGTVLYMVLVQKVFI